tara:strand:- start:302 stop:430 length:129 start_codon:yes stop_codon:yes gene_type:complete
MVLFERTDRLLPDEPEASRFPTQLDKPACAGMQLFGRFAAGG